MISAYILRRRKPSNVSWSFELKEEPHSFWSQRMYSTNRNIKIHSKIRIPTSCPHSPCHHIPLISPGNFPHLSRAQRHGRPSLDRNIHTPAPHLIGHDLLTANHVPPPRRQPLEPELENASLLARIQHQVQPLAVAAVRLGNEHVREPDVRQHRPLHRHGVGPVQRRVGQVLVAHQARHERHHLRGGGEAFVPERAGLGGLDGEELRVQLLEGVRADPLVAELGGAAGDEGAQGADAALVVARVHLVGAAEVFDVEFAVFGVADVLVADDGPDAGADVREVGGQVHGVDAVGEGA